MFVSCLEQAERQAKSDESPVDVRSAAAKIYAEKNGSDFSLMSVFNVVEHAPKFKTARATKVIAAKRKSFSNQTTVAAADPGDGDLCVKEERPQGQKAAKKNRTDDMNRYTLQKRLLAIEENKTRVVQSMLQLNADQALLMAPRGDMEPDVQAFFDEQRRRAFERMKKAVMEADAAEATKRATAHCLHEASESDQEDVQP